MKQGFLITDHKIVFKMIMNFDIFYDILKFILFGFNYFCSNFHILFHFSLFVNV
jgi:hypothetical protein